MGKSVRDQGRRERAAQALNAAEKAEKRRKFITFAAIGLVSIVLLAVAGFGIYTTNNSNKKSTKVITPSAATKDYGLLLTAKDFGKTIDESKIKANFVIYEDFSCGHCKNFEDASGDAMDAIVSNGKGTVEYRVVGFLDPVSQANGHSKRAASAALCVLDGGDMAAWKKFHDWLFTKQPPEGQPGPTNSEFIAGAKKLGLAVDAECIKQERYVPWMKKATEHFTKEKIGGTPTVILNGKKLENYAPGNLIDTVDALYKNS